MQQFKSKISSKGQIVIPAELRRKLKLKEGTPVEITEEEGQIRISAERSRRERAAALKGICKGSGLLEEFEKYRREERAHEDRER